MPGEGRLAGRPLRPTAPAQGSGGALAAALALATALLALPLFHHSDDGDALTYRVIARHMVEDGTWTDLRYLTNVHPTFREHLPFGLWPYAAAIRLVGEGALPYVAFLFSLGTLLLTAHLGRRLLGGWGAALAVLLLGLNESFWADGARSRLDPLLILLATAAAAPVLLGRRDLGGWLLALVLGAAAAAVKGPFGLVPLAAATAAAAALERRWRTLLEGGVVCLLATLPVVAFLLHDRLVGHAAWWDGYVQHQLLASAVGARSDGASSWWFPARTVAMRLWPALPLLLWGCVLAAAPAHGRLGTLVDEPTRRLLRLLALHGLLMLVLLTLPGRKLWFHVLVAFPGWVLLAACAAAPWVARALPAGRVWAVRAVAAAAAVVWVLSPPGATAALLRPPSVYCAELGPFFSAQPAGTQVLVAGSLPWQAASSLAAEFRLDPLVELTASPDGAAAFLAAHPHVRHALLDDEVLPALEGWRVLERARSWSLLERQRPAGPGGDSAWQRAPSGK